MDKRQGNRKARVRRDLRFFIAVVGLLVVAAGLAFVFVEHALKEPVHFIDFESRLDNADLDGFYKECVETVNETGIVPQTCRNAQIIEATYNLQPRALLNIQLGRMIDTARRIAFGDIITEEQYEECLERGECVKVPLIPAKEKARKDIKKSPQARRIAALFSHLVEAGTLTPEVCAFMDECRAMVKIGLITRADFSTVTPETP